MAFGGKSMQRLARSIDVTGADSTVTSNSVEYKTMPSDKSNLGGGSIGSKGKGGDALRGGRSLKMGGGMSTLYGSLGKDGRSTYSATSLRENSPGKGRTTRESPGRTGDTFSPQMTASGKAKSDGKQGANHSPIKEKMGKF